MLVLNYHSTDDNKNWKDFRIKHKAVLISSPACFLGQASGPWDGEFSPGSAPNTNFLMVCTLGGSRCIRAISMRELDWVLGSFFSLAQLCYWGHVGSGSAQGRLSALQMRLFNSQIFKKTKSKHQKNCYSKLEFDKISKIIYFRCFKKWCLEINWNPNSWCR